MRQAVIAIIAVVGAAALGAGCSTTTASNRSDDHAALDVINGITGGYGPADYGRGHGKFDAGRFRWFRYPPEYYQQHFRTKDDAGHELPLVKQAQFLDVREGNVAPGSKALPKPVAAEAAPANPSADEGEDVEFVDSDGRVRRLSEWRGKPVVVIFTRGYPGYVCPLCTAYTAQFAVAYPKIKELGADVLLVYPVEQGSKETVKKFMRACEEVIAEEGVEAIPYPVMLDLDMKATRYFGIEADLSRPATYIFDADGVLVWGYEGNQPHQRPKVERVIEKLESMRRGG